MPVAGMCAQERRVAVLEARPGAAGSGAVEEIVSSLVREPSSLSLRLLLLLLLSHRVAAAAALD